MKTTNYNDVTVAKYLNDCKYIAIHDGYEQAGSSIEKAEIKKIIDQVTDWNDIDQAYDAGRDVQNVIFKYTQLAKSNRAWNEFETECRKHYKHQIEFTMMDVTYQPEEHEEYRQVLVDFGCMKTRHDFMWSIAHLNLNKLNAMLTEMWKIRAHWLAKVEAGQFKRKAAMVYSF